MQESELIALIARIAPEQMEQLTRRAQALSAISSMQPVGRRALAAHVNLTEREIRTMAAALREGSMGVMDYYQLKNMEADTDMREGIAKASAPVTSATVRDEKK